MQHEKAQTRKTVAISAAVDHTAKSFITAFILNKWCYSSWNWQKYTIRIQAAFVQGMLFCWSSWMTTAKGVCYSREHLMAQQDRDRHLGHLQWPNYAQPMIPFPWHITSHTKPLTMTRRKHSGFFPPQKRLWAWTAFQVICTSPRMEKWGCPERL